MDEGNPTELRAQARVGQVLRNKWHLDRLIGVGGMAAVYAATHRNGARGAVKMLHVELSSHPGLRRRFLSEGYAANRVDHPGAVAVRDDDETEDGAVFLVMELLDGQSLESVMASRPDRRLPVGEVLAIGDALLDVLAAAHDKGIVHRDLKPDNLFVTRRAELKVLDFGIARLLDQQGGGGSGTKTGTALGTPAFMPPEQALGNVDQIDARTDLWAAGATLFALATGRPVHGAPTLSQLLLAAMTQPAPPLASALPDAPPALCEIVDRALRFDANERWQSAAAMRAALQSIRWQFPGQLPVPEKGPGATGDASFITPGPGGRSSPSGGGTELAGPAKFAAQAPATAPGATSPSGLVAVLPPAPQAVPQAPVVQAVTGISTTGGAAVGVAQPSASSSRAGLIAALAVSLLGAVGVVVWLATRAPGDPTGAASPSGAAPASAAPTSVAEAPSAPTPSTTPTATALASAPSASASVAAGSTAQPGGAVPHGKAGSTSAATAAPKAANPLDKW
jgi:eukaryotic-like serine/threonine-protein kinase